MKIIKDESLINDIFEKHSITDVFSTDIKKMMFIAHFPKGDFICKEDDVLNYIFFLVKGKAKVFSSQENGKSLLLCFYQNFEIIGEVEFFTNTNYTTNVQVLTDAYCIGIKLSVVKTYLMNDNIFLRYISSSLATKLSRNTRNCSFNLLYPLENRLATYILASNEDLRFHENLTLLSELLATSYRHLLRVLTQFCTIGLLKKYDSYYEIINFEALEELSNKTIGF